MTATSSRGDNERNRQRIGERTTKQQEKGPDSNRFCSTKKIDGEAEPLNALYRGQREGQSYEKQISLRLVDARQAKGSL
jgi:hypothetical protein